MEFQTVRYSINGAVATLALNRPERLNALNANVHADIRGPWCVG
jgi:2-(1,2-epoxy-1,2-dihydrophenyl)acetyl-CoA isomerase